MFVWFDFGGVLSPPLQVLFDTYQQRTGISRAQLWAAMTAADAELGLPTLASVELAVRTEAEWGARLRHHLAAADPGIDLSRARLEEFGAQWFAGIEPNHVMVNTLRYLRDNGVGVGILSNNVVEWGPHWKRMIAATGKVDALVDSCEVGARKPQPEIFDIAEKMSGRAGERFLLIDDVEENCAAARNAGWTAIRFRDNLQVCRELVAHTGVPSIV
jgi:putative hydrolase of the HAD superfamily